MYDSPLIVAKTRPLEPGLRLRRPGLLQRMRQGLDRRLTLILAGPGYGKSLLLADFARESPLPVAWYQADSGDGDLLRFLWHLVYSLEQVIPEGLPGLRGLIGSSALRLRGAEEAVATLVADLVRGPCDSLALCIDDWHLVPPDSQTAAFLLRLVTYLPDHVHLYVAARSAGTLPVARWQLQGWAEEIGSDDLRFDEAETAALLGELYHLQVNPETVRVVSTQTEGWAAALYLAGRSMRLGGARGQGGTAPAAPLAHQAALTAYLDAEVMANLPPERRSFLLETAVLESLPAALCDRLRGSSDAAAQLAALAADGLFTYRVDPAGAIYRYHPLFREYLLQRLVTERGKEVLVQMHRRAARELLAGGDRFGAMENLLAAGDQEAAAGLLEELGVSTLWSQSRATIDGWLRRLAPAMVQNRPRLLLQVADRSQWEGDLDQAAAQFDRAAALFEQQGDAAGLADAWAGLGYVCLRQGRSAEARRWLERALEVIPPVALQTRATCLSDLAFMHWMGGETEHGEPLLREALTLYRRLGDRMGEAWVLNNVALNVQIARGRFKAAAATLHQVLDLVAGTTNRLHCTCLLNLGSLMADMGRYGEARGYLQRAMEMAGHLGWPVIQGHAAAVLGRVAAENGDCSLATGYLAEAREIEARGADPQLRLDRLLAQVLVERRRGSLEAARELAAEHLAASRETGNPFFLALSWFQTILIYLEGGQHEAALGALETARESLTADPSPFCRFQIRLAEAIAGFAARPEQPDRWAPALAEVLELAESEGYEGPLYAEGRLLSQILGAALRGGITGRYLREVYRRLEQRGMTTGAMGPGPGSAATSGPGGDSGAGSGAKPDSGGAPGTAGPAPRLRITMLGGFRVEVDGKPVPDSLWRGRRPQELARLLALRFGTPLGVEACIDALWPHLNARAARTNFRVTLHWLRRALGEDLVQYNEGQCALAPGESWVDVAEFRQLLQVAAERWGAGDVDGAAGLYEQAVALYQGDLLEQEPPSDWFAPERESLRDGYLDGLSRLAVARARRGDLHYAIEIAHRVLHLDPLREPAYRLLMRLLARTGRRSEVVRLYRLCEESLRRELGVQPSAATRHLYNRLVTAGR